MRRTLIYGTALAVSFGAVGYAVYEDEHDDGPPPPGAAMAQAFADTTGLTPNELEEVPEPGSYDDVVDMLGEPVDADENEASEIEEATFDVGEGRFVDVSFNVVHGCEMFEGGTCFEGDPGAVVAATEVDEDGNLAP